MLTPTTGCQYPVIAGFLAADARIRTADPFITRDLWQGIDPSGQADVRGEYAGDCEGDPERSRGDGVLSHRRALADIDASQ